MQEAKSILDVLSFRKTEEKEELRKCFNFSDEVFEKTIISIKVSK